MASITASSAAFAVAGSSLVQKRSIGASSPIIGLRRMGNKGGVTCSAEKKKCAEQESGVTMGGSMLAAAAAAAATVSSPALGLVDERMSTEGVGLPFGLSNNLLGWILFGVFGLIWALYFSYTSSLDEDEDSGDELFQNTLEFSRDGWILFGVFGLIWALYFSYTSSLDEDEDSGLSL